ncbi:MAG: Pyridoxal phosphate homeostasis protein [Candidatus Marinimicrobia bacterium]|nr:Pyridoxal phosphate homeostasis protein [Candidatus Neomarinimicrobiota bacterium]
MAEAVATKNRVAEVREKIGRAAEKSGRSPDSVAIIAVGKTHPAADFYPIMEAGIWHFGESRVQEAEDKIPQLTDQEITWHMIGHLQRNKAGDALEIFDQLHSLDSKRLARRLQQQMEKLGIEWFPTFVQVNTSGEQSKYGIDPKALKPLMDLVADECPRLKIKGLMTMAPLTEDEKKIRETFRRLRELSINTNTDDYPNAELGSLSMGMTNDYEIAVEEGATHVRIGRAIFGERLSR